MQCVKITLPSIYIKYKKMSVPPVFASDVGRMPTLEQNGNTSIAFHFVRVTQTHWNPSASIVL